MKASSQAAGWKGILIKHGEKGVLGIIGALVLWMMFSGLQKEGLKGDKSPADLKSRIATGEQWIESAPRLKQDNGGEKFTDVPYHVSLKNGLEPIKIEGGFYMGGSDFLPIAKRTQPQVFPVEDVHATALVVQVALNDEKAVKQQQGFIIDRNNKKALDDAKKAAALARKQQAEEAKKAKALANQQNRNAGRGGGEGGRRPNNDPLQFETPMIDMPLAPVEQRPPHPAIQNLTGITSATKGIAVVTGLIPYKKQLEEFNRTLVEGKDVIPNRKPEEDSPWIATFVVERALVVNPSEPDDKLVWVDITGESQKFFAANAKQLSRSEDPVVSSLVGPETVGLPKKNVQPWFTVSPLPTLADRKWQREVTHPRIPLLTDLTVEEIEIEQANAFMPTAPAAGSPFGQPAAMMPIEPIAVELPEYVLFRHIDFNVAPGQTYRYRVTLQYLNPNVGLDSKYIGSNVAVTEVLPTTPSSASNSVALSPLHQILAGGEINYPPPKRYDSWPTTRVWQWLIDIDVEKKRGGGEVAKDFPNVTVGDLLEFVGTVKNNLNRAAGQPEELVDYNFTTHKIPRPTQMSYLVDVFGKQAPPPPPRRPAGAAGATKAGSGEGGFVPGAAAATTPEPPREQPYSEILYVDQDGKLRSSSSPYADTTIDNYKLRYESLEASPGNPGMMEGGGRGGEMPGSRQIENPLFKGR